MGLYTTSIKASRDYFHGKLALAGNNINIFLNNPCGIGEHGKVTEEFIKLIEDYTHYDGCIQSCDAWLKTIEKELSERDNC